MRCPDCGHDNPDDDNFCGICGETLARSAERTRRTSVDSAAAAFPVSGPVVATERLRNSFVSAVGELPRLEQEFTFGSPGRHEESAPPENGSYQYAFDDEVRTSRFAKYVSLIALLICGVLLAEEWGPLKQQVMDALAARHPAAQPAAAPVPATGPVAGAASDSTAARGGGSAQTGQPQASLPPQPTPGETTAAVSSRKPLRARNGKALKLRPGQPQPGRRRRTRARPLASAGRQPGD